MLITFVLELFANHGDQLYPRNLMTFSVSFHGYCFLTKTTAQITEASTTLLTEKHTAWNCLKLMKNGSVVLHMVGWLWLRKPRDISPKSINKSQNRSSFTIHLPPTEVVFKNSRYLHPSSIRSSKQRPRDRFIRKVRVSADPSLVSNFMVMAIYGTEHENLAFCASGDIAWTIIRETSPPLNYKDIMFHEGNLFVIDKVGRVQSVKQTILHH